MDKIKNPKDKKNIYATIYAYNIAVNIHLQRHKICEDYFDKKNMTFRAIVVEH